MEPSEFLALEQIAISMSRDSPSQEHVRFFAISTLCSMMILAPRDFQLAGDAAERVLAPPTSRSVSVSSRLR